MVINDGHFPMNSFVTYSKVSLFLPHDISLIFFTFVSFSVNFLYKRGEKRGSC